MPALPEHKHWERSLLGWRGAHQYQLLLLRPMRCDGWLQALSSPRTLVRNSQIISSPVSVLYKYLVSWAGPALGSQDSP